MRCEKCSASCGDDFKTRNKYTGPEDNPGNSLKVILLQIFDLIDTFNLQKQEVRVLVNNLIDEHIIEHDLLDDPVTARKDEKKRESFKKKKKS